jgi:hypothetical protein
MDSDPNCRARRCRRASLRFCAQIYRDLLGSQHFTLIILCTTNNDFTTLRLTLD